MLDMDVLVKCWNLKSRTMSGIYVAGDYVQRPIFSIENLIRMPGKKDAYPVVIRVGM